MPIPVDKIDYAPFTSFLESIRLTWKAVFIYQVWFVFKVLLQALLPGKEGQGKTLSDGSRLSYKLNGLLSFIITILIAALLLFFKI